MKRSTNLAYTRAARRYRIDTALFLQDLGIPVDGIFAILDQMQTGKPEPSNNAVHLTPATAGSRDDMEPQVTADR